MAITTIARVSTPNAHKYVQQLCRHWAHNLSVELSKARGVVTFPRDARGADWPADAVASFTPDAEAIDVRIDASSPEQRDALKEVIASHLDRFAFREAPLTFDWQDG